MAGAECTAPSCCASADPATRPRRRPWLRAPNSDRGCVVNTDGRSPSWGTIRLRKGDLAGAEAAFSAAHDIAWPAQPGLALLRLAQGDAPDAAALIADAVANPPDLPWKERPPTGELRLACLMPRLRSQPPSVMCRCARPLR